MKVKWTTESFLEKVKNANKHRDYDYSEVVYVDSRTNVKIRCVKHDHWFYPQTHAIMDGRGGCKYCAAEEKKNAKLNPPTDPQVFLGKIKEKLGDKYDYSKTKYVKSGVKVTVTCPIHGDFLKQPALLLLGRGCPKCAREATKKKLMSSMEEFKAKLKEVWGDRYTVPEGTKYRGKDAKLKIICSVYGEFKTTPHRILAGVGCKSCYVARQATPVEEFIRRSREKHGPQFDFSNIKYSGVSKPVTLFCIKCNKEITQTAGNHINYGCPTCAHTVSQGEQDMSEHLKEYNLNVKTSDRAVLRPKELDIYFPDHKLAIEYTGLYWHCYKMNRSDTYTKFMNHLAEKQKSCERLGIQLLTIYEDEWVLKKEICLSRIKAYLGIYEKKYFARKLTVKTVDNKVARQFFEYNHIQGGKTNFSLALGLYNNEILISVMAFGKASKASGGNAKNTPAWLLTRFCTRINETVVGGASKLFKYFLREYRPDEVVSYADWRWSSREHNVYKTLGFTLESEVVPRYWYVQTTKSGAFVREHRYNFRPQILKEKGWDKLVPEGEKITEINMAKTHKYYQIPDCGKGKYVYRQKETPE